MKPEEQLQATVVDYLSHLRNQGVLMFFHPANGMYLRGTEKQRQIQVARFKRLGMSPGVPDLVIAGADGAMCWIELKAPKAGRLTNTQIDWQIGLQNLGHHWAVCRSLDDVIAALENSNIHPLRNAA